MLIIIIVLEVGIDHVTIGTPKTLDNADIKRTKVAKYISENKFILFTNSVRSYGKENRANEEKFVDCLLYTTFLEIGMANQSSNSRRC